MRVELSWTISAADLGPGRCCVCRKGFERGIIEAHVISDADRLDLGEVCPACLETGEEHIERRTHAELRLSIMGMDRQLRMEKRAIVEGLEACPSFAEYTALEAACGGPRYATDEEAQAAWERGEW